ncbi:hypothetical protein KKD37_02160 [Patescibacteria group bacterium]|nr:hypothetical protein [Patescibacteria group bacterium]
MDKNIFLFRSLMIVIIVSLVAILVIDSQREIKKNADCKKLRIKALTEKFFTWDGIVELNQKGEYQPKCL